MISMIFMFRENNLIAFISVEVYAVGKPLNIKAVWSQSAKYTDAFWGMC